ncbi:MAG: hypothetical protein HY902_04105 [Deltaproteobacteria bacterium]|nr:hypothetical protein [Deltaproteobacteria bacterium]
MRNLLQPLVDLLTFEPGLKLLALCLAVLVQLAVERESGDAERILFGQPVVVRGCPAGARCSVEPNEVNVRVQGSARLLRTLAAEPPDNLVIADLEPVLGNRDGFVHYTTGPLPGVTLTVIPTVAKFHVVYDAPPAKAEPAKPGPAP